MMDGIIAPADYPVQRERILVEYCNTAFGRERLHEFEGNHDAFMDHFWSCVIHWFSTSCGQLARVSGARGAGPFVRTWFATDLEQIREYLLEYGDPRAGLVVTGDLAGPDLADHSDAGRHAFVCPRCRSDDRADRSQCQGFQR